MFYPAFIWKNCVSFLIIQIDKKDLLVVLLVTPPVHRVSQCSPTKEPWQRQYPSR